MATEKIVNYTEAQTKELVATYVAEPTKATVEAMAAKLGKTAKSIVAKLVKEGVYVSAVTAKAQAGQPRRLKADVLADIAKATGLDPQTIESLEKATLPALEAVLGALTAVRADADS